MSVGDAHYIKRDLLYDPLILEIQRSPVSTCRTKKEGRPPFFSKKLRRAKPFMVATTRPTHFHVYISIFFLKDRLWQLYKSENLFIYI